METLKDLWASLVAGLRDRTTNPLTVAFLFSWCAWNYRFFLVLLGDAKTDEKLSLLNALYPDGWYIHQGGALLYPAVTAAVYVFLYPFLGRFAVWAYRSHQVATANLVKGVEKARLITREERDQLVRMHEKERKKLSDEIDALSAQLTAMRTALATAEEQAGKGLETPPPHAPTENQRETGTQNIPHGGKVEAQPLDEVKTKLLLYFTKFTTSISLDIIANNLKINPAIANSELRELRKIGLVAQDKSGYWGLTEIGEALAVKLLKENDDDR